MVSLVTAMQKDPGWAAPVLVIANKADTAGLDKAATLGVPTAMIPHAGRTKPAFEAALTTALEEAHVDLICLAGFMRVLSADFVTRWEGRILNIHPSLLPLFKGLHTHARALGAGVAVHGCSVHEVTPELDAGRILGQAVVPVMPGDTEDTLAARVLEQEHALYPHVLKRYCLGEAPPFALI